MESNSAFLACFLRANISSLTLIHTVPPILNDKSKSKYYIDFQVRANDALKRDKIVS